MQSRIWDLQDRLYFIPKKFFDSWVNECDSATKVKLWVENNFKTEETR